MIQKDTDGTELWEPVNPLGPPDTGMPGTAGRIEIYRKRVQEQRPLFHPEDPKKIEECSDPARKVLRRDNAESRKDEIIIYPSPNIENSDGI